MDFLTPKQRSDLMRRVKAKNSKPEIAVRRMAFGLGYRFRLHRRDLPGSPDLVFVSRRKVIFVHGCFWHRHPRCSRTTMPKTRMRFWRSKFEANKIRDRRAVRKLRTLGWKVLVVWTCEVGKPERLEKRLKAFLS